MTNPKEQKQWRFKDTKDSKRQYFITFFGLVIFLIAARFISNATTWPFVWDAPVQALDFVSRMLPPDAGYLSRVLPALWDTINLAVFSTALAAIISLPLAVMAAQNTTPHRLVRLGALAIIVTSRSVNSLIWALILVQIFGPGLFAGMLAIAVRSLGMITKLFYEAIEEINKEPIEAMKSTGATMPQVFIYGYLPQLMPSLVGVSVYRWEVNIRESAIIGLVGGGGIGFLLNSAINRLRWDQVSIVLIVILATVFVSEVISSKARSAVT